MSRSWSAGSSPRPTPQACARPASPPSTRPKDWDLNRMMRDIVALVGERARRRQRPPPLEPPARGRRRASSAPACATRDLSAAPAVLNLVESRTAGARAQTAALLAAVSPAALGGEAPAHIVGVTGPPGVGKSSLLSRLVAGVARARPLGRRAGGRSQLAPLGRRAARRPRPDRGRSRPTAACSSARPRPATGSAASPPRPERRPARWRRRSTWS